MTTVSKEMNCGNFENITNQIKIKGDFKSNKESGAIESLNGTVYKEDIMSGNVSASLDNSKIKINMYGVDINDSEEVMAIVNVVVTDLYNKYKPI